jgi:DNA-binding protein H-NS
MPSIKIKDIKNEDLQSSSLSELFTFQTLLEEAIEYKTVSEQEKTREMIQLIAEDSGYSLDELFGKPFKMTKKVAVKYRSPEDASLTWTGRGRKPNWIKEYLSQGNLLDDIMI